MKKLKLGIVILTTLLTFTSCTNDKDSVELSNRELLIQNSPWTYDRYELIEIIAEANGGFTSEKAKNNADSDNTGSALTFNNNGAFLMTRP